MDIVDVDFIIGIWWWASMRHKIRLIQSPMSVKQIYDLNIKFLQILYINIFDLIFFVILIVGNLNSFTCHNTLKSWYFINLI